MNAEKIREARRLHHVPSDPQPERHIFHPPMHPDQSVGTDPSKMGGSGFFLSIPLLCYKRGI